MQCILLLLSIMTTQGQAVGATDVASSRNYALVYFGRFAGSNNTRARNAGYRADMKQTLQAWKSVTRHVILPNERSYRIGSGNSSIDVFVHHWNCSLRHYVSRAFGMRLRGTSCHDEEHGPYQFESWGGLTCEDIEVAAVKMGVEVSAASSSPEIPQFCMWKSIQYAMDLLTSIEKEHQGGLVYKGIMLLRHDLYVTTEVLFSEALKGIPPRAVVIPRQCSATGLSVTRRQGNCGNFIVQRAGSISHELDWLWFASSSTVLNQLAQLVDTWPKRETVRVGDSRHKTLRYDGSHTAWPRRAANPLGLQIFYWKMWNVDFILSRNWPCQLSFRSLDPSLVVHDARPDQKACPPRFLQNQRKSLCSSEKSTFFSSCARDPSNFAVIGK